MDIELRNSIEGALTCACNYSDKYIGMDKFLSDLDISEEMAIEDCLSEMKDKDIMKLFKQTF